MASWARLQRRSPLVRLALSWLPSFWPLASYIREHLLAHVERRLAAMAEPAVRLSLTLAEGAEEVVAVQLALADEEPAPPAVEVPVEAPAEDDSVLAAVRACIGLGAGL